MKELINLACSNYTHNHFLSSETEAHSMGNEIPLVSIFHSGCDQNNMLSLITFSTLPMQCFQSLSLKLSH